MVRASIWLSGNAEPGLRVRFLLLCFGSIVDPWANARRGSFVSKWHPDHPSAAIKAIEPDGLYCDQLVKRVSIGGTPKPFFSHPETEMLLLSKACVLIAIHPKASRT